MTRFGAMLDALLVSASPASGWGGAGHQAIGEAAQTRLSDKAHAALAKILIGGDSTALTPGKLAAIAVWPDEIRLRKGSGIVPATWSDTDVKEADAFNTAHAANGSWHFVNLPLGASGYPKSLQGADPLIRFASRNDIVQAINRAVAILEAPVAAPDFSKAQAVRWLVHLVGDIHQPLHVTSGYYKTTATALKSPTIIKEPAVAAGPGVVSDRGGNGLLFHPDVNSLHSVWDGCLVQLVDGTACASGDKTYTGLARKLAKWATLPEATPFKPTGNHHGWAAQWATDSLKVAVTAEAYGVKLAAAKLQGTESGNEFLQARIASPSRPAYTNARVRAARDQLVKAAIRLAELLNAIAWK
jgi:hypothetical protein